jgi:hypothetical protein
LKHRYITAATTRATTEGRNSRVAAEGLARSREMLETIAGAAFPESFSDKDALLVGTGRRANRTLRADTGARRVFGRPAALDEA